MKTLNRLILNRKLYKLNPRKIIEIIHFHNEWNTVKFGNTPGAVIGDEM
jgi:hypothetical protein